MASFHIILISGLAFLLWKRQPPTLKPVFWPALAAKLISGVALGLLYTYYYSSADTFVYFNDASTLAQMARKDTLSYLELLFLNRHLDTVALTFQMPRALFLTKFTSVFNIVTGGNYWISGFYFSLISFLGAWFLVQNMVRYLPYARWPAIIAFLFFPSVVFWTSGLLKESIAVAALFFLTALLLKIWFHVKPRGWEYLLGLFSVLVFWNLKYYYVAVFLPVAFTTLSYHFFIRDKFKTSPGLQVLIWCAIFLLPVVLTTFLHPNFNADRILTVIVTNNAAYNEFSEPDHVVYFDDLRPTVLSILANAPWALFSGLFRPLFWEADTIVQFIAGVENSVLLILFLGALLRSGRFLSSPHRLLILGAIVYVIILCVLITISAPNFGTLSRYRVGYLSFFVFVILCDNPLLQYFERSFSRLVSH